MLNLQEIEDTIYELENGDTTFDTCIKLSALYNVHEHFNKSNTNVVSSISDTVTKELSDILPHYEKYIEAKSQYQADKTGKDTVLEQLSNVCIEIDEFIRTLYSSTDMEEERFLLYNTLLQTSTKISSK